MGAPRVEKNVQPACADRHGSAQNERVVPHALMVRTSAARDHYMVAYAHAVKADALREARRLLQRCEVGNLT